MVERPSPAYLHPGPSQRREKGVTSRSSGENPSGKLGTPASPARRGGESWPLFFAWRKPTRKRKSKEVADHRSLEKERRPEQGHQNGKWLTEKKEGVGPLYKKDAT